MTTVRQRRGATAEQLAAAWLRRQGYAILARNVRTPLGEIDVVAQDGRTLCFVEVRSRHSDRYGTPEESITPRKQQHMLRAAQWYLQQQRWREETSIRFDLIALRWQGGEPQIHHVRSAVEGMAGTVRPSQIIALVVLVVALMWGIASLTQVLTNPTASGQPTDRQRFTAFFPDEYNALQQQPQA